jgi:hypothetical protein
VLEPEQKDERKSEPSSGKRWRALPSLHRKTAPTLNKTGRRKNTWVQQHWRPRTQPAEAHAGLVQSAQKKTGIGADHHAGTEQGKTVVATQKPDKKKIKLQLAKSRVERRALEQNLTPEANHEVRRSDKKNQPQNQIVQHEQQLDPPQI